MKQLFQEYKAILIGVVGLVCAVLSALLGMPYLAYGVIACTVVAAILAAFNKINIKAFPYIIFTLGLAFLYQTTLISSNLIGTDIHTEYYFYLNALGGWDTTIPHAYNTAFGTTVIAPLLTKYLGLSGLFIYKALYPLCFSFVPVILYHVYKRQFDNKVAFLGCMIFITLPTYLLELIGLPRQMLGELMLALCMLLVINQPIKKKWLIPLLIICGVFCYLFHYVMGVVVLLLFAGCLVTMVAIKFIRRKIAFQDIKFPLKWMAAALVIPAIIGGVYYCAIADGVVAKSFGSSLFWLKYRMEAVTNNEYNEYIEVTTTSEPPETTTDNLPTSNTEITYTTDGGYFSTQEPLIRTALGLDFAEASIVGKGFRILQYAMQLSVIVGCIWLAVNRRKVSVEYIGFAFSSVVLLAACILLPRLSNIINATRFYHIALFSLSPLAIIGMQVIFRNLKTAVVILLVPYILYSTGAVFELAKETKINNVNIPYSIALSNGRISIVGEYSNYDAMVANWIVENDIQPVLTDISGMLLLSQQKDPFEYINRSPNTHKYYTVRPIGQADVNGQDISELKTGWGYLPNDISLLSDNCYIFLTERSMQTQTVLFKPNWYNMTDTASGMRQQYSFVELGISLDKLYIAYQRGDAVVLCTSEPDSVSLTIQSAWDIKGHIQDVVIDGDCLWLSSGGALAKYDLDNIELENPIISTTNIISQNRIDEISGLCIKDGLLYACASRFIDGEYLYWVFVFDKDTPELKQEISIEANASVQEGISYSNGYWWISTFDCEYIRQYDNDWQLIRTFELDGVRTYTNSGGHIWLDGKLWINYYNEMYVYAFGGDVFTLEIIMDIPSYVKYPQGFCVFDGVLYMADFYNSPDVDVLHKIMLEEK